MKWEKEVTLDIGRNCKINYRVFVLKAEAERKIKRLKKELDEISGRKN